MAMGINESGTQNKTGRINHFFCFQSNIRIYDDFSIFDSDISDVRRRSRSIYNGSIFDQQTIYGTALLSFQYGLFRNPIQQADREQHAKETDNDTKRQFFLKYCDPNNHTGQRLKD